jgi:hypothetical protein
MGIFGVTTWEDGEVRYMEIMTILSGVPPYELMKQIFMDKW